MIQKTHESVTPSGVRFVVRMFIGEDYDTLTSDKNVKDGTSLDKVCAAVLLELGDKKHFTERDIVGMLSNDRKYILLTARMFTMRFQEEFKFTYQWPAVDGKKQSTEETVIFSPESFKNRGYGWVEEQKKILADAEKSLEDDPENDQIRETIQNYKSKYINGSEFPVMFESYSELFDVQENKKRFKYGYWKDEESGQEVRFKYITGEDEKRFASIDPKAITINTMLQLHKPQFQTEVKEETVGVNENTWIDLQLKRLDGWTLEQLRGYVSKNEGNIDTLIVLENPKTGQQQQVDLLTTQAFFLPSQAL